MMSEEQVIRLVFGFKVRYLRRQKKLSYQELSGITGLSTSYLNDIEKGKRYPKPNKISRIAEALGVDYNYLVGLNASKKLQPIIDLLTSRFFKLFPLDEFGISQEKLIELFAQTPAKVTAFISTIFRLARNYQIQEEEFYKEALRSYQDMHDNHFPKLEQQSRDFKEFYSIEGTLPFSTEFLEDQLNELYHIQVDRKRLGEEAMLKGIRSYFNPENKTLFLKAGLSPERENFLLARELGFQYLQLDNRPRETPPQKIDSFELLLHNYKASHFAAALLMEEEELANDIRHLARQNTWDPQLFLDLLGKYRVTPEMLIQRLTNILPHHFGIKDLFFLRIEGSPDLKRFSMTKDLHLSQLHNPYNNELQEHYCNRWVSITSLKKQRMAAHDPEKAIVADAQISRYWNTDSEYLCISIASPGFGEPGRGVSVTIGMLLNTHLRSIFYFLSDPKLAVREVHTTCERCGIANCDVRGASPSILEGERKKEAIVARLKDFY